MQVTEGILSGPHTVHERTLRLPVIRFADESRPTGQRLRHIRPQPLSETGRHKVALTAADEGKLGEGQREIPTDAWLPCGEPPIARD